LAWPKGGWQRGRGGELDEPDMPGRGGGVNADEAKKE